MKKRGIFSCMLAFMLTSAFCLTACDNNSNNSENPSGISVILNMESISVEMGDTYDLAVTVAGTEQTISWSSSDASVVTVDQNGKVTAVGAGTAIIAVTVENITDTCMVTVNEVQRKDFYLSYKTQNLFVSYSQEITPIFTINGVEQDVSNETFTYWSDDPSIATVNSKGRVTGKAVGETKITCEGIIDGEKYSSSFEVNVTYITLVELSHNHMSFQKNGNAQKLEVVCSKIENDEAISFMPEEVSFVSSDETVVTVDATGTVTPVNVGYATVIAIIDGMSYDCTVVVGDRLIQTAEDFAALNGATEGVYIQTADIDMTSIAGFSGLTSFAGTFDGNGYELKVSLTNANSATFGTLEGTVKNVWLDVTITAQNCAGVCFQHGNIFDSYINVMFTGKGTGSGVMLYMADGYVKNTIVNITGNAMAAVTCASFGGVIENCYVYAGGTKLGLVSVGLGGNWNTWLIETGFANRLISSNIDVYNYVFVYTDKTEFLGTVRGKISLFAKGIQEKFKKVL